jgi:hypothetical protein
MAGPSENHVAERPAVMTRAGTNERSKGDHMQERLKPLNTAIARALAQLDTLPSDDELDVENVVTVWAGAEPLARRLRTIEERLGTGEEEMG